MADIVKSVEFIEVNTTGTSTSYGLTKGQDYTNCVPFLSVHGDQDYQDTKCWDCYFTGTQASGTVNFERANGRSTEGYVKCFVVEFDSDEVYVEQGTFNLDSTTTDTVTTSGVFNPERTAFTHFWKSSSTNRAFPYHLCRGRATASGTLDFYRSSASSNLNGHWFLFEAKNDQFFVEHTEVTDTAATVNTRFARSYDPLKTFFIASNAGGSTSAGYLERALTYVVMANRDVVRRNKSSSSNTTYLAVQAIEFQDTNIHVPYANAIELDATSKTQGWSADGYTQVPVDLDYSMVINTVGYFDRCASTSTADIDGSVSSVKFVDSTSIQMLKNSQTVSTYPSIFVVDWKGYTVSGTDNSTPLDPDVSFVKSVQNIRITTQEYYGLGYLTKGQNIDNCVIFSSNYAGEATTNSFGPGMHDVFFSDAGVVEVYRFSTTSSGVVDLSVVEFYPDQVRVQSGVFTGDLSTEVSVPLSTSVDSDRSFLLSSWSSYYTGTDMTYHNIRCRVVDSDNVGFYCITGSHNHGSWFLAEDITASGTCFDVLHWIDEGLGDVKYLTGDRKFPADRSFSLFSHAGGRVGGEYGERSCLSGYYYNPSLPIHLDVTTESATKYYAAQSVRITRSGRYYTYQWSAEIDSAATTDTETLPTEWAGETSITAFNTNLINAGKTAFTTQNDCGSVLTSIRISNYGSLTATAQRATTSTYDLLPAYCFVNWAGVDPEALDASTPTRSLIRSINKFSYTGSKETYTWYFDKYQNGANCIPLATHNSYASTNRSEENQRIITIDHELGYPHSLSMYRGTGDTNASDSTIVYVVEFDDEQVRVQSGTYGSDSTDFTVTIDAVDVDKAFLVFYTSTRGNAVWTAGNLSGTIESSTSLRFRRTSSGADITVAWYVVECLGDQWSTQHLIAADSTASSIYNTFESIPHFGKYWMFNSYAGAYDSTTYAQRNLCRTVARADGSIEIQRAAASNTISYFSSEVVKFNDDLDIRVFYNTIDQSAVTSDTDMLFDPAIEQQRSIVFNPQTNNHGEINTSTATDNAREAFYTQELIDFDTAQPKLRVTKGASTYSTQACACVTEFPEYNMYFMEGYTKEQGVAVSREVLAYRSSTGELVDSTTSASGTGYFFLETKYSDEHHVVCLDDVAGVDYNHLIYGKLSPTVISGTFAYNEGLTPSGVLGEIPLGRL